MSQRCECASSHSCRPHKKVRVHSELPGTTHLRVWGMEGVVLKGYSTQKSKFTHQLPALKSLNIRKVFENLYLEHCFYPHYSLELA